MPIHSPRQLTEADILFARERLARLVVSANDLREFSVDTGVGPIEPSWNPAERSVLQAELDSYYAHLYGLNRDELRYILEPADVMGPDYPSETFRVLKTNEIRQFGEYRTQRLVLEAWDRLFANRTSSPS
jgi:hypothetical protein